MMPAIHGFFIARIDRQSRLNRARRHSDGSRKDGLLAQGARKPPHMLWDERGTKGQLACGKKARAICCQTADHRARQAGHLFGVGESQCAPVMG